MNNKILKKFLKLLLMLVVFNSALYAEKQSSFRLRQGSDGQVVKTSEDKRKNNDKIDIKTILFNNKKNIIYGFCGLGVFGLLFYFFKPKQEKEETNNNNIQNNTDNIDVTQEENKQDKVKNTKLPSENNEQILEEQIQSAVKDLNVELLQELSNNSDFFNACVVKIDGKNAGELILDLQDEELGDKKLSQIIEILNIEEVLLNDLIVYAFDRGLFNSLVGLFLKENSYIDTVQNQIILSEILDLYEKDSKNIILLLCLNLDR